MKDTYITIDGLSYENFRQYVLCLLGFCGCSADEPINDCIKAIKEYSKHDGTCWYEDLGIKGEKKYLELLLAVLDNAGLIEHGFTIRGSWLTDKGKKIAEGLNKNE